MAVRHVALAIGAALLLGLAVYLFVEVRAQPAPPPVDRTVRMARPATPGSAPAAAAGEPLATRSPDRSPTGPTTPTAGGALAGSPPSSVSPAHAAGGAADDDAAPSGPKLEAAMDEANKAYDRGDYEDAKALAGRLLARLPSNVRMLRIMVSASCIDGDIAVAQASYVKLPPADQAQMRLRCARYGVTFAEHP
ncbi:MAG TPA: hypothetical protein VFK02_14610 [Kofleriaceae bacterium]|nr:hypothetical protein [Kofleriaceae bacterium]